MPIDSNRLAKEVKPEQTILFFGAGASLSSNAPSVADLINNLESEFKIESNGYSLREYASIVEENYTRHRLIEKLRSIISVLRPTGSLLNLPLYNWKGIYTTNYDSLIEQAYRQKRVDYSVYSSNYDFGVRGKPGVVPIFKIHGTIEKDISFGDAARIIISDADYDHTQQYRENIYDRLKSDLINSTLIIIGHSLADEHIKEIANRQADIISKSGGTGRIVLMMYTKDENRARLWEKRGIQVAFGGLDDFFEALSNTLPCVAPAYIDPQLPLDHSPSLHSTTLDVSHAITKAQDVLNMFNGWPATYSDIAGGFTFERNITKTIESYFEKEKTCAVILGASGVGKTTSSRQLSLIYREKGFSCWEHKTDYELDAKAWIKVAQHLHESGKKGFLFVDQAHQHLHGIQVLIDSLYASRNFSLILVCASTRNHWNPRIKAGAFYKVSKEFVLNKLHAGEIDKLLSLIDSNEKVRRLVEDSFSGFSRYERRRRLMVRCESETFVCLKNIFASEKFDHIILREYAELDEGTQDIYKRVAAMQSCGIHVHRQLIIRLLGIHPSTINSVLANLTDIVNEYTIDERQGIYGWKGRHGVIAAILTKYKYPNTEQIIELFEQVIESISPTYDIEIRTIRDLCNISTGIPRISDKSKQNILLRRLVSCAPNERIPRHRLVRNLIRMGEFEKAEAEIRIYEKDFGRDASVTRYRIQILVSRALNSEGILAEDRLAIMKQAWDFSTQACERYSENRLILGEHCEVGLQLYRISGDYTAYDSALKELKVAELRIGDPQITALIRKYEQRISGQANYLLESENSTVVADDVDEEME